MGTIPSGSEMLWSEILGSASRALRGRIVSVWESDNEGALRPIAASDFEPSLESEKKGLSRAMRLWNLTGAHRHRWVASHIAPRRWCVAPVRPHPPQRPVVDGDRRSPERMVLELAGACIGMIDRQGGLEQVPAPDREVLRRTMRDLEAFFEHVPIGLHWMSGDGTILRANQAVLELLGLTAGEYVGHKVHEFYVDAKLSRQIVDLTVAGEVVRNVEARLRRKDGAIRTVAISASPYFDQGRYVHSRVATRDLGDQQPRSGELMQFQAMVESAHDAIIGKTLDGTITYWNPAAARQYGYTADEVIGKSIATIIPPEMTDELAEILARLRRGERIENYETVRVRKDGVRINVSVTISPILDNDGQPLHAYDMLNGTADAQREIELRRHGLARAADLAVHR